jgi:hypothetical protein
MQRILGKARDRFRSGAWKKSAYIWFYMDAVASAGTSGDTERGCASEDWQR